MATFASIDALKRAELVAKASGGKLKKHGVNGRSSSDAIRAALKKEIAPAALVSGATALAKKAVAADNTQDYALARSLYHDAVDALLQWAKRAPDDAKRQPAILERTKGYMTRIERLDAHLAQQAKPASKPAKQAKQATGTKPPKPAKAPKQNAGNINIVAWNHSDRLVGRTDKIRAAQADAIVAERWLNGAFADDADLLTRLKGRGVTKKTLDKLKLRGWKVKPVRAAAAAGGGTTACTALGDLRDNGVAGMGAQTWRHRGGTDLYTELREADVVKRAGGAEVDHVWECQLLDLANARAAEGKGVAARTRGVQDTLKRVVNSVRNLNVTTHKVNQAKKGPFMQPVVILLRGLFSIGRPAFHSYGLGFHSRV